MPIFLSAIRLLLKLALLALVLLCLLLMWLDTQIREQFTGRKWDLPSHIYARPLELYLGSSIASDQFLWEIEQLGYRMDETVDRPGEYSSAGGQIRIFARGFEFWDSVEQPRLLNIRFGSGGELVEITDSQGVSQALVRFEPLRIGGIYPQSLEDRLPQQLGDFPPLLVAGLIQTEDRSFFEHRGISVRGILRAALANFKAGAVVEGGSTLTQQLVKNFYLSSDRTLTRKVQEVLMSFLLEIHYSKEEILETYLNEVYMGQSGDRAIHGMGMAAWHYFRLPVDELEPHQAAFLVGLLKGPSQYDPWSHPQAALQRRNLVLQLMADQGMISQFEFNRYRAEPLDTAARPARTLNPYPGYMNLVLRQLETGHGHLDLKTSGFSLFTFLDPWLQFQLEQQTDDELTSIERDYRLAPGTLQTGAIVTRIGGAEVVALVGGSDPRFEGFNRALDASRPIGSLVKPFVYLTALQNSDIWQLSSPIEDAPFILETQDGQTWVPQNYDGTAQGPIPLYQAMAQSLNLATARLGLTLGVETVFDTIRLLGVDPQWQPWPSFLLGAGDLSPFEVATLYHTIAADGFYSPLVSVAGIYNPDGTPVEPLAQVIERRIDVAPLHLIQYAMQVVMLQGTGRAAQASIGRAIALAGKTGTTNDLRDSWFAGFDGKYVAVFWVGRDDNQPMPLTGSSGALRLWTGFFRAIGAESMHYVRPPGVEYFWVNTERNMLSSPNCAGAVYLPFIRGTQPTASVNCDGTGVVENWLRRFLRM